MKPLQILKQLKLAEFVAKYPSVPPHAIPRPSKFNDKTANGLTNCILEFLRLNGWQAERINTTGRVIDNRKTYTDVIGRKVTIGSTKYIPTTGTKGSADISATIKGRSVKIEIKIGADRQSEDQKEYQKDVERSGGVYILAKTFDDFYYWYQDFIK